MNLLSEKIKKLFDLEEDYRKGFADLEISEGERNLNVKFPQKLKEFYKIFGRNKQINEIHNRLLSPQKVYFEDEYLVFYEENQQGCFWAIKKEDLKKENPPVYEGYKNWDTNEISWYQSHQNMEDFCLFIAFYNGTMGGLTYNANIMDENEINVKAVEFVQNNRAEITELKMQGQRFFTDNFQEVISLCYDQSGKCTAVFVGTENEERFQDILELFGYDEWSYTSYDDDFEEE